MRVQDRMQCFADDPKEEISNLIRGVSLYRT